MLLSVKLPLNSLLDVQIMQTDHESLMIKAIDVQHIALSSFQTFEIENLPASVTQFSCNYGKNEENLRF